nr:MAG TPA: Major capsid protein [Caudoviricetes sp.]
MLKNEIASINNGSSTVYEVAFKSKYNKSLNAEEKEISSIVGAWAKEIGERGSDPNHEIAAFVIKTIEPVIYDYPDELLDELFDRGSVDEFDDIHGLANPENTLVVHEAAKGGNVPKSYIDYKELKPVWTHKQIETELRYTDLRKNGFKTIANLTMFAEEALKNDMFKTVFNAVDSLITSTNAEQYIASGGSTLTQTDLNALILYIIERGVNPFVVCRSAYAQQIANMSGQVSFMSNDMKNEYNRYGLVNFYNGARIAHIPSAIKVNGEPALPDKKIFGIAGKIGTLDMRGSLRIYEDFNNRSEKVELKITGFEYGYMIEKPENIAKLVLV